MRHILQMSLINCKMQPTSKGSLIVITIIIMGKAAGRWLFSGNRSFGGLGEFFTLWAQEGVPAALGQAWEWPTVPASISFIKASESHVCKELCGQHVTERFDPLQATSSGLKVSGRNDCKRFIQNPCLEILQVTYQRLLMLQEPCGRGMTSS